MQLKANPKCFICGKTYTKADARKKMITVDGKQICKEHDKRTIEKKVENVPTSNQ